MRSVRIPPSIAVTRSGAHYVVSAVNGCRSRGAARHQSACREPETASATSAVAPTAAAPVFRLTSLLPADWSALLRMSRRLTHPGAAFNFSSPGDTAALPTAAPANTNHAYLHIVQRVPGDFTPNNMVYHHLQQYHLTATPSSDAEPGDAMTTTAAQMTSFTRLVTDIQRLPAQPVEEATAEWVSAEDTALAAATTAEKHRRDPLASSPAAQQHTAENVRQMRDYAAAPAASDASRFIFFPFPVPAAVSIPYCTAHFCVLVNLKPIVPHHLMVVPIRCVGTIHGLTEEEVEDWGRVMRCTIDVLEHLRRHDSSSSGSGGGGDSAAAATAQNYSIAVQQGTLAGQTVEHLHVHVIPFDPRGKLAGEPEADEAEQQRRPPRTPAVMKAETDALRPLFARYANAANDATAAL